MIAPMFNPPKTDAKFSPSPTSGPTGFGSSGLSGAGSGAQTVIARGVRVEGDFRSQGNVTIEGELVGSLTCGGHLTIGSEAHIQASITADEATISGEVQGDLKVARRIELKNTARLKGDVLAETLAIEPGAMVEGAFKIGGGKPMPEVREAVSTKPKIDPMINTPAEAKAGASN